MPPPVKQAGHPSSAGAKARVRRHRKDGHAGGEEGGAERWLVTYADMLTLLLVLFIVLFSISVVNTSKFISLKTSLASAFGTGQHSILDGGTSINDNSMDGTGQQLVNPGTPNIPKSSQTMPPVPAQDVASADLTKAIKHEINNYKQIEDAINKALAAKHMQGAVQFSIDRRGLIITVVTNQLVFPGNSAQLLPGGQEILAVVAPQLANVGNSIEVDGFTNQLGVSTDPYPSGWELSSARASAVVRFLIGSGITESRLSAVGFSDQRPLYPADDPRSVTRNRRVEIVVLSSLPAAAGDALQAAGSGTG